MSIFSKAMITDRMERREARIERDFVTIEGKWFSS